jgi:Flp pilus assembly protein CpaB
MEATSARKKIGRSWSGDMFSNRRTSTLIAIGAALLAGILLFIFVQQYRKSVNGSATVTPVFVASGFIPRGTSATVIASGQLLERASVKSNQVKVGAISDPSVLHGEVAASDIFPGEQITAADFTSANVTIASDLTGSGRAVAVPVDSAHGLIGYVHAGDHVDVLASYSGGNAGTRGSVTTLAQNVLVLSAPATNGGGIGSTNNTNVVLRVSDKVALALTYAADNGKVWITLRPPVGAIQSVSANPQGGQG